ncbi:transmembrane epididymal protein 1 [Carica papaya]|uniref:transmembrane epididymal protein 1 n=1 Tax=Carica papaya TaxID=3649 RepID=UPI000B8CEA78|nr:transmembrane epididymal protein 1 [Carica papaya]
MGTFLGHLVPGLALTFLGLWHIINTIKTFCLNGSASFRVKFWFPFDGPFPILLKHLELIFIFSFSIFVISMQVLDFPFLHFAFKLDNFEHATMYLHLAIFSGFSLFAELTHSINILSGVPGIFAASVFGQELFLLHFHSADHVGLEGHYHWLLQLIVFVSFLATLAATSFPTNFSIALILSILVVFQGCWLMNMSFMLWVPKYVPLGCISQLGEGDNGDMSGSAVTCESPEADLRARALANLQFSWILSGILVLTGCVCLKFARKYGMNSPSIKYKQLQGGSEDHLPTIIDSFVKANP